MKSENYLSYPEGFNAVAETFDFLPEEERKEFLMYLMMILLTEMGE